MPANIFPPKMQTDVTRLGNSRGMTGHATRQRRGGWGDICIFIASTLEMGMKIAVQYAQVYQVYRVIASFAIEGSKQQFLNKVLLFITSLEVHSAILQILSLM